MREISLRWKLLAAMLLATFSALAVAGAAILYYDIRAFRAARINDLATQLELLAFSAAPALQFDDPQAARQNVDLLQVRPQVRAAAIYDARGALFAAYQRPDAREALPDLPGAEGARVEGSAITMFKRIVERGEILGSAYLRSDYIPAQRVKDYLGILLLVTLGAMAVATLMSLWLQGLITRPLRGIIGVAQDVVRRREYSRRAEKHSQDEVGLLVDAFNGMLDEIAQRAQALESSNRELMQAAEHRRRAQEQVLQLNTELEGKVQERTRQLELINKELESFCYSVSHDLRGPLRSISGFSQALQEELPPQLPGESRRYLDKIKAASQRMGQLIEDLLNLSRVSRGELNIQTCDVSGLASSVVQDLQAREPDHSVEVSIWPGLRAEADAKLLRIVLENLLSNAWKFSARAERPRVEVGGVRDGQRKVLFVRDNGAGFDMKYADKLFGAFQRLHGVQEFPGTGIGLATVQRIIHRHGGRIWFQASPGNGAIFYFTLRPDPSSDSVESEAGATASASPETGSEAPRGEALPRAIGSRGEDR